MVEIKDKYGYNETAIKKQQQDIRYNPETVCSVPKETKK